MKNIAKLSQLWVHLLFFKIGLVKTFLSQFQNSWTSDKYHKNYETLQAINDGCNEEHFAVTDEPRNKLDDPGQAHHDEEANIEPKSEEERCKFWEIG